VHACTCRGTCPNTRADTQTQTHAISCSLGPQVKTSACTCVHAAHEHMHVRTLHVLLGGARPGKHGKQKLGPCLSTSTACAQGQPRPCLLVREHPIPAAAYSHCMSPRTCARMPHMPSRAHLAHALEQRLLLCARLLDLCGCLGSLCAALRCKEVDEVLGWAVSAHVEDGAGLQGG